MAYIIKAYKKGKYVGILRDDEGKIFKFETRKEAQTTANIESTQIESEGLDLKVSYLGSIKETGIN